MMIDKIFPFLKGVAAKQTGYGMSLLFFCMLCALFSCTQKPEAPALSADGAPPDSLKIKAVISVEQNGKTETFPAVLFAVPGKRYRLELTGPLGIGVASLLWTDSGSVDGLGSWTAVFPTEDRYASGRGPCVRMAGLPGANIHKVAALAWGGSADSLGCFGALPAFQAQIKKADPTATWGAGIWKLPVPEGFLRID
jgi:hypothetical protein